MRRNGPLDSLVTLAIPESQEEEGSIQGKWEERGDVHYTTRVMLEQDLPQKKK